MQEEIKAVHREPHPFVGINHIAHFSGRTVAFVGKVDRVEDGTLYMKTGDGKSHYLYPSKILKNCATCLFNHQ